MRTFLRLLWLAVVLHGPFFGFAQVIRPELIRTPTGATFVFNTAESFFAVDIAAGQLSPKPTSEGFYQADARLVRVMNTPQKELTIGFGQREPTSKEFLQLQFRRDLDEELFSLQRPIPDTRQEYLTTSKGRLVLHWWFDMPGGNDRGATQRHYVSTICDRQILTVIAPLLATDTPDSLRQYLIGVMQTVRESNDPINVSEYVKDPQDQK